MTTPNGPRDIPRLDRRPVAAILLAAGQSLRMGSANKLLLEVDGEPMVRRAARVLLASRTETVVTVLGHDRDAVARALEGLPLEFVSNPRHGEGQATSVRAGMAALDGPFAAIMVCLADQPWLDADDINFLIDAFFAAPSGSFVVPVFQGQRGNPIMLAEAERRNILGSGFDVACRHLIERNPENVRTVEAPNNHFVVDVDTPEAYAGLRTDRPQVIP